MGRDARYSVLRWTLVLVAFVLGATLAYMLQDAWVEAHPRSCMPTPEFVPRRSRVTPTCLIIGPHYLTLDLLAGVLLAAAAWRTSRA